MDSYRLGRGGYVFDIGSYVLADPGPNFGFDALYQANYAQNPVFEGGQLAYEANGPRTMTFPIRLASSGAFSGGMNGLVQLVRSLAKPGGFIDLQPEGVASSDAVRFDIIDGRLDENYSIFKQRLQRREATLKLTVQPFGYWPTDIILASVASMAMPGVLTLPNASILGDAPGVAKITVQPSAPSQFAAGTWVIDSLAWALGGLASFVAQTPGGGITGNIGAASVVGNKYALGSQSLELFPSPTQAGWTQMAAVSVASLLEPAYRGRFRALLYARLAEPSSQPWQVMMDVVGGLQTGRALASANQIATVAQDSYASVISASPAYQILDMGELVAPVTGSGQDQSLQFRIWANPASSNLGIATPWISLGGLYLLPLDGGAGILPRGLAQPTSGANASTGRFMIDGYSRTSLIVNLSGNLATPLTPMANALAFYTGDFPRVVSSSLQLDLQGGFRKMASGATAPLAHAGAPFASVSVTYRPRFTFGRGV